jgi:hypothetical protein
MWIIAVAIALVLLLVVLPAGDSRLTDDASDELLRSVDIPTIHAFKLAVNRLEAKSKDMQWAIPNASKAIIAIQKAVLSCS